MKLEKDFLIKSVEGDFYYSTIQLRGEINLTDAEKREYFKAGGCKNIKTKLIIELPKQILDEEEKKYLSDVIRPFRDKVKYINKRADTNGEYIFIYVKDFEYFSLPYFKKNTMYKGMELNKEYTLEDLNL